MVHVCRQIRLALLSDVSPETFISINQSEKPGQGYTRFGLSEMRYDSVCNQGQVTIELQAYSVNIWKCTTTGIFPLEDINV